VETIDLLGDRSPGGIEAAAAKREQFLGAIVNTSTDALTLRDANISAVTTFVAEVGGFAGWGRMENAAFLARMKATGLVHFTSYTIRSTPIDQIVRLIFPLARPVESAAWRAVYSAIADSLGLMPFAVGLLAANRIVPPLCLANVEIARACGKLPIDLALSAPSRSFPLPCKAGPPDALYPSEHDRYDTFAEAVNLDGRLLDPAAL